jgi:hypothetical protein
MVMDKRTKEKEKSIDFYTPCIDKLGVSMYTPLINEGNYRREKTKQYIITYYCSHFRFIDQEIKQKCSIIFDKLNLSFIFYFT